MSKRKKQFKRERVQFLNVGLNEKQFNPNSSNIEINIELDLINNSSKVINSFTNEVVENKSIVLGYQGENKFRVTSEIPTSPHDHSFNFLLKLKKYKHIIAIDTNTFSITSKLSNTEFKLGLGIGFAYFENDESWKIQPINVPFITSFNCDKPENENWVRLIELLKKTCKCIDSRKIAIVVDSDLGNLKEYNNRTKPIFKNYYLPVEFEWVFASDKVKDNIFNIMISECHSFSKKLTPKFIQHFKNDENKLYTDNQQTETQANS